ncbi:paraquat-inducible protein B [Arcobacter venerupis]|uniref:Paraquat-inducible protein B n=1 Tax=Arcobacter venerupis TaxID=1054033 RepID=A0AAE7BAR9_9BACT|nr:MlaD family protein [Arcobacter venerupis]QKF67701.1 paraquat-inducible protein B [Arcobacter venerupis]RWS49143.1 paraquat-inducible protein B [Arcobacter venerupis]
MSNEIIEQEFKQEVYEPKIEDKKPISFIWVLPLIILAILGWIAYESYMKKGTNITLVFKSAEGLKEGVTPLEYKGLQLGKVTKISIHEDLKSVKVNVLVDNEVAKYVANESSQFWIKKPTISLTKISGLNTLISGYKIELSPVFKTQKEFEEGKEKYYFDGLDTQPNDEFENDGYYVSLIANDKDNVEVGTPIFYNNFQIGEIIAKEFIFEKVYFTAYIYDKFNYLVNKSSKFVMNEALKVSYGASGLNIEVGSLYSALVGGITVLTPDKEAAKIIKDEPYLLYGKKDDLKKKEIISLNFLDVNGIEENTPIIFKGIEIGKIIDVKLNKDVLISKAFVYEEYKYLLTNKTKFFVEEPTISFDGVKNLGNIVKGNFISLEYKKGDFSNTFTAIKKKDLNKINSTIKVELLSENLNSISEKSKVYYKNIEIGFVDSYALTKDLKNVKITLLIDDKYKDLINDNNLFYDMSSKLVEMKNLNLNINYSGIEPLLNGAIGLIADKIDEGKLTKNEFKLYSSYKEIEKLKRFNNNGFTIEADFDNSFEIKPDMAIVYKNQEIGFVKNIRFDDKKSKVTLFVYTAYKKYITDKSRFYKKGIVDFKASLSGVLFEVDNFTSLIEGSIHLNNDSNTAFEKTQIYATEDNMKNSTNSLTIIFDNVEGVQENFSQLTYKGVNVGKVTNVSLNEKQQVVVKALIYDDFTSFAKEGTIFYLKKPRISLQEIANAGSTVMAVNIGVIKSDNTKYQIKFEGLENQPSVEKSYFGTVFKVEDPTASSVNVDSPVYYKNVQIGKVSKIDLSDDGSKVVVDCLIYDKYVKLIRKNSEFYDISGFEMKFSIFSGSSVESNTFTSLLKGGLVVVTPYEYGEIANPKDKFSLVKTLREDWKSISPSIK